MALVYWEDVNAYSAYVNPTYPSFEVDQLYWYSIVIDSIEAFFNQPPTERKLANHNNNGTTWRIWTYDLMNVRSMMGYTLDMIWNIPYGWNISVPWTFAWLSTSSLDSQTPISSVNTSYWKIQVINWAWSIFFCIYDKYNWEQLNTSLTYQNDRWLAGFSSTNPWYICPSVSLEWYPVVNFENAMPINNSCTTIPNFSNLGTLTTGTPTIPNQAWIYSVSPWNCTYDCTDWYSGTWCSIPPTPTATCSDGIQNQDETGIDIWGVCWFPTVNTSVSGAVCTTERYPIYSSVSWYSDFWNLANNQTGTLNRNDGTPYIFVHSYSSDQTSDDIVIFNNHWTGSSIPSGSIKYPWTETARLNISNNGDSFIGFTIQRQNGYSNFNVVNFYNTSSNFAGIWGRWYIQKDNTGYSIDEWPIYSTGWVASLFIKNWINPITWIVNMPVSGFSGMRIWYAPLTSKTSCSTTYNKCQWSNYAGNLTCEWQTGIDWLTTWACGIAGSGSIYWSGACVPLVDSSGAIQNVIPLGKITTKINPDGTTSIVVIAEGYDDWSNVFSCEINSTDSWYTTIGNYIMCPFTKIAPKVFKKIFMPIESIKKSIEMAQIETKDNWTVGNFFVWTWVLSTNSLILTWKNNQLDKIGASDGNWWNKLVKFLISISTFAEAILVLGTIVWFINKDRKNEIP